MSSLGTRAGRAIRGRVAGVSHRSGCGGGRGTPTEDTGFLDGRSPGERDLHLLGIDLLAVAEDDQALQAAGDVEKSIGVDRADVSGVEPSLGIDRLAGEIVRSEE